MKIRNGHVSKAVGFVGSHVMRLWMNTLRFRYHPLGPPLTPGPGRRCIYPIWHEDLFLLSGMHRHCKLAVMISDHADGQLITDVVRHLGFGTVRGSSTHGGPEALRGLLRCAARGPLTLTVDGPTGPRRRVKPGLVYLAARTGLPVVPVGVGYTHAYRMNSWDKFALPRPFSAAWMVSTDAITVPRDADRRTLEKYRRRVQAAMEEAGAVAERLADRERRRNAWPWQASAVTPTEPPAAARRAA